MNGKGYFIWNVEKCQGGDIARMVIAAREAELGHVLIKISNGALGYNGNVRPLAEALQAEGIEVWGWGYTYGYRPQDEARMAGRRIEETGVTGFVVDAEVEYKGLSDPAGVARAYMRALRAEVGWDFPLGLTTYRYPTYHPQFPFRAFLEFCDVNVPQVYWLLAHNPAAQLERCVREYAQLTTIPMIPAGAAWTEQGWKPTVQDENEFMAAAWAMGAPGVSFWSWQHAERLPELWQVIADFEWLEDEAEEEIPEEEMGEVLDRLNAIEETQRTIIENQETIIELLEGFEIVPPEEPEPPVDPEEPKPPAPPVPPEAVYAVQVVVEKTNARWSKAKNANGAPIMTIYPRDNAPVAERIQFFEDMFLEVKREKIRADGGALYYELTRVAGREGETLYVKAADVMKTW